MRESRFWQTAVVVGLAAVILTIDQASKLLVTYYLSPPAGVGQVDIIGSWLRLSYTTNTGAVFGILPDKTLFFSAVSLLAVPALIVFQRYLPVKAWPAWIAVGLLLGGTMGNLIDRLRFGYVVDFIDAGIGSLRWYTFNVADAATVVSVLVLAGYLLFFAEAPKSEASKSDHAA